MGLAISNLVATHPIKTKTTNDSGAFSIAGRKKADMTEARQPTPHCNIKPSSQEISSATVSVSSIIFFILTQGSIHTTRIVAL
jgi:hypothetical protein